MSGRGAFGAGRVLVWEIGRAPRNSRQFARHLFRHRSVAASQNLAAADDEPAARALIERYTAALVAQDMAALRAVIHPQVLACITDDNRDYFDFMFAKDLGEGPIVAAKHKIARMGPPSDLSAFMPADLFTYPV